MEYTYNLLFLKNWSAERNSKDNPVPFLYFTDEVTIDHKPGLPLDLLDFVKIKYFCSLLAFV